MESLKKKDYNIEFIRIIACFMVVFLHTSEGTGLEQCSNIVRGVVHAFLMNGVPLFLMIIGFCGFESKKKYKDKLLSLVKHILLPAIAIIMITEILNGWIDSKEHFIECITNSDFSIIRVIENIIKVNLGKNWGHLWYIYSYIRIMLLFPLLKKICTNNSKCKKIRLAIIIGYMLFSITGEVIYILNGCILLTSSFWAEISYVFIGYEIKLKINRIRNTIPMNILFLLGWGIMNVCVCILIFLAMKTGRSFLFFQDAYRTFYLLSSIFLFCTIYNLRIVLNKCENLCNVIVHIADQTFSIYLLHYMIVKKLASIHIGSFISNIIPNIVNWIIVSIFTILLSYAISIIIDFLKRIVVKYWQKLYVRKN